MKRILPVIFLICLLLMGCGKQTAPRETIPSTTADPVIDGTEVDQSQLETVPATQATAPGTQPTAPTQGSVSTEPTQGSVPTVPTQGAPSVETTTPTQGTEDTPAPTQPVPPATDSEGYFNQVVKP